MFIKKGDHNDPFIRVISSLGRLLWNRKAFIVYFVLVFIIGALLGLGVSSFIGSVNNSSSPIVNTLDNVLSALGVDEPLISMGLTYEELYNIGLGIRRENVKIPVNYVRGLMSDPEHIDIDIDFEDFQKIAYKREIALTQLQLFTSSEDFVPAVVRYNGRSYDVKLRLKGDHNDHWSGSKWSLRIVTKGDTTIFGMKEFSIQDPRTRNYLNEWLFHQAIAREGIIAPRYSFIDVSINGQHKGIYAVEEHFDKLLIEDNDRREGPIIRSSGWDAFQTGDILNDPLLYEQFLRAEDLLNSFNNGTLSTSQVFDTDILARFLALCDLLSAGHATTGNLNLYYNPVTSRLEPISFDGVPFWNIQHLLFEPEHEYHSPILDIVFSDMDFFEKYLGELERVSQPEYLDGLFEELGDELRQNLDIIHRDDPFFHFSEEFFTVNQQYIQSRLSIQHAAYAYLHTTAADGSIAIKAGNRQPIPLEITGLAIANGETILPVARTVLPGKVSSEPVRYVTAMFQLPDGLALTESALRNLRLEYRLLGTSRTCTDEVFPWPYPNEDYLTGDLMRRQPNAGDFGFIVMDEAAHEISVKPGSWVLTESLIIPAGYTFICGEGTSLELHNDALILSYSPLSFTGSGDNPVVITASGGQGMVVLGTGSRSVMENVHFQNLAAPAQSGWELTGAVTFYESPVVISNCLFESNTSGDDALNIIRSDFEISGSLFKKTLFDALDIDFSNGTVTRTSFMDCGNDALDISGSIAGIYDIFIDGAGDKGVSVGESSRVTINGMESSNGYIGVASKDQSSINLTDASLTGFDYGLAAYQKKAEYGPAAITASGVDISDTGTPCIVEEGSSLSEDGRDVTDFEPDVYKLLYPGEE